MILKPYKVPAKRRPKDGGDSLLEEQLSSVVEREGAVLQTPLGPRRGRKLTQQWNQTVGLMSPQLDVDEVASLDRAILELAVSIKPIGGDKVKSVNIKEGKHAQSPYVISLQHLSLARQQVTRSKVTSESFDSSPLEVPSVDAFSALGKDLTSLGLDPRCASGQFTPNDFDQAYTKVYGRFEWLTGGLREVSGVFGGWFKRAEKEEREIAEEAAESIGLAKLPRLSFARMAIGLVAMVLVVTLPANAVMVYRSFSDTKDEVQSQGEQAVSEFMAAGNASTAGESAEALKRASAMFRDTDAALENTSALATAAASLFSGKYRSAKALLEVGDKTAEAARLLAVGFDKVFSEPDRRLDERLNVMAAYARTAQNLLSDSAKAAASIDADSLPPEQRDQVAKILPQLDESTQAVREFTLLADFLARLAGRDYKHNYLVIFQNPTEIRPTGGFMGSYAEVAVDRGAISKITVPSGGTYDIKGQLTARVLPPQPLQLINTLWQFQDANWFPDFPTSAEKIRWFWSKSGQPTIDGIITVNSTFMEKVLAVTGPIEMPEYGKTIDASNFQFETQKAVEIEYDKAANTPKKFVGDLMGKVMERSKSFGKDEWLKLAALAAESISTKDIQLYFTDEEDEALAEKFDWNGRLKPVAGDSLAVIETNIAGQKTDGVIDEDIEHTVQIDEDGSITDHLTLYRKHNGIKNELFNGVRNVVYLRVYVPKGSKLISAAGFNTPDKGFFKQPLAEDLPDEDIADIEATLDDFADGVKVGQEGDRTVISGWLQLDPGRSQTIALSYKLPFTTRDLLSKLETDQATGADSARGAYLLLLTSQSGKGNRKLVSSVEYPASWGLAWSRKPNEATTGLGYSGLWDKDKVVAALMTTNNGQEENKTASAP
ncbi:MAG: DUF4012 domain-containing protein [Patescibacteria group bacterium]|nr:DUF4012 domain-containing protein [Patescibacteria group bacterium]